MVPEKDEGEKIRFGSSKAYVGSPQVIVCVNCGRGAVYGSNTIQHKKSCKDYKKMGVDERIKNIQTHVNMAKNMVSTLRGTKLQHEKIMEVFNNVELELDEINEEGCGE